MAELRRVVVKRTDVFAVEHPNGFKKVVLPVMNEECQEFRIHFWSDKSNWTDIHNHTSEFLSYVVNGCVEEEFYDIECKGCLMQRFDCTSNDKAKTIDFQNVGVARLKLVDTLVTSAGNIRLIESERLHRAKSSVNETITILFKSRATRQKTSVFLPIGSAVQQKIQNKLESNELLNIIDLTSRMLANHKFN